jgi:hypothetical protein
MVDDGRPLPPFATRGVLGIAGVVALLHCTATAFGAGYWFDEVYMLAIGRYHLDWGSADQPPLTPAVAALADALAPGSLIALRLPAVLATAGAVVVAGLIVRELGCDGRAQVFTAAAQATGLWTTLAGHWLTPYTLVLGSYGLVRLLRADEIRPYRYLGVTFVALYVVFVATAGRPYYLAGLYAPLAAAGALGLQRRREAGRTPRRWLLWPAWLAAAAAAVGILVVSVSITRSDVGENIARRTADVYDALPASQRDRTVIVGESYIVAAFLDGVAPKYHLPTSYSTSRSYGYFPPPPADHDVVLYVGGEPDRLRPYFSDARRVADVGEDMHAFVLTGQQVPWTVLWPRLRTLTVS